MYTFLFSLLFLLVGFMLGWFGNEKYTALIDFEPHEFEKIIEENPHPEIYSKDGKINREDYLTVSFELGYDPSEDGFDGEDNIEYIHR